MWFEWFLALRFLREGRLPSVLILAGVSVGVAVTVFLSALIGGLQSSLIQKTLGSQPHVIVRSNGKDAGATFPLDAKTLDTIAETPGVTQAAPVLSLPAFAVQGESSKSLVVRGVDPARFAGVIDLQSKLKAGTYSLTGGDMLIGADLANELSLSTGDMLTLLAPDGKRAAFTVTGIYDLGNKDINLRWAFVGLGAAQSFFGKADQVTSIEAKVADIFTADSTAATIALRTGLTAESWSQQNAELMTGLKSQSASSYMIQFFVIMAVALGIASVLVVSVVQKSKEIGILKAMGASTGRITRIFLIQGGVVGVTGSLLGAAMGIGLSVLFVTFAKGADGQPLFPANVDAVLILRSALIATVVGLLAAVAPARRAAKLEPAEVIRYG